MQCTSKESGIEQEKRSLSDRCGKHHIRLEFVSTVGYFLWSGRTVEAIRTNTVCTELKVEIKCLYGHCVK